MLFGAVTCYLGDLPPPAIFGAGVSRIINTDGSFPDPTIASFLPSTHPIRYCCFVTEGQIALHPEAVEYALNEQASKKTSYYFLGNNIGTPT